MGKEIFFFLIKSPRLFIGVYRFSIQVMQRQHRLWWSVNFVVHWEGPVVCGISSDFFFHNHFSVRVIGNKVWWPVVLVPASSGLAPYSCFRLWLPISREASGVWDRVWWSSAKRSGAQMQCYRRRLHGWRDCRQQSSLQQGVRKLSSNDHSRRQRLYVRLGLCCWCCYCLCHCPTAGWYELGLSLTGRPI